MTTNNVGKGRVPYTEASSAGRAATACALAANLARLDLKVLLVVLGQTAGYSRLTDNRNFLGWIAAQVYGVERAEAWQTQKVGVSLSKLARRGIITYEEPRGPKTGHRNRAVIGLYPPEKYAEIRLLLEDEKRAKGHANGFSPKREVTRERARSNPRTREKCAENGLPTEEGTEEEPRRKITAEKSNAVANAPTLADARVTESSNEEPNPGQNQQGPPLAAPGDSLPGWAFADGARCVTCGGTCTARDPEGRMRHPACGTPA